LLPFYRMHLALAPEFLLNADTVHLGRPHSVEARSGHYCDVLAWSRLHGFVSREIAGNYASMGIDPDQLFEAELSRLAN
jgi:hypothetical protein